MHHPCCRPWLRTRLVAPAWQAIALAVAGLLGFSSVRASVAPGAVDAAANAAATAPACKAISDGTIGNDGFYWEIDDANGIVTDSNGKPAAGSINPPGASSAKYTRDTLMPVASASKWLEGAYVAEVAAVQNGNTWSMPVAVVPFLNFTSGYANQVDGCNAQKTGKSNPTVQDCLNQPGQIAGTTNGYRVQAYIGGFAYNSGHLEVLHGGADPSIATVIGGANDDDKMLADEKRNAFAKRGVTMNLQYFSPILAGGVATTAGDYAAFLRGLINTSNPLIMGRLLAPTASDPYAVCTNPADPACPSAKKSPLQGKESYHYSLAHWIEDDPQNGDGAYSSAGAYGFYPWVDASKTYAGVLARADTNHTANDFQPGYRSQQCGMAIRQAFLNGVSQPRPSQTTLTSSFNPMLSNQATTLIAKVAGTAPTGTVTFSLGGTALCTAAALNTVGTQVEAVCVAEPQVSGAIVAQYSGDASNAPSTSAPLNQSVVPVAAFNPDQFGLTGTWYNPATSGQGILLQVLPDHNAAGSGLLFAGFYTFTSDGDGARVWYTLQGDVTNTGAAAQLGLYTATAAGNFAAGPTVGARQVGNASLRFGDCAHMTLSYTLSDGSGLSGTIPLTRLTTNTSCSPAGDLGESDPRALLSGAWYVPATSGQGLVLDVSPSDNVLVGGWYTYSAAASADQNRQTWYVLQSHGLLPGVTTIENVPIYTAGGGVFDQPTLVVSSQVGTANVRFAADCRSITLDYAFSSGDNSGQRGSMVLGSLGLNAPCSLPASATTGQ